ncbi:hypothetical protein ACLOJK_032061 [Asimina triloba]
MTSWSGSAIALIATSTAAAVVLLVGGLFSLFLACRRRKTASADSLTERAPVCPNSPPCEHQKMSPEGLDSDGDGDEISWIRGAGLWGPQRALFVIKEEEEDETTELEDGRTRSGRRSSRRSYAGSQDSGGMSPSTGTTPFLTPLSCSPLSTPPSTPSHHRDFGIP